MLIFDIGANKGNFTDKCISVFENNLNILLVEPNPNLYEILVNKYKNYKNVKILDNILSSKSGEFIDFYLCRADGISTASLNWINNSRFSKHFQWDSPIKKQSVNLDYLIELYGLPDLIKLDVEGYEYEVIKGLSKKNKEVCFEWAEEEFENVNLIINHLTKIGFSEFGYIIGDEYMERPKNYTTWEFCEIHKDIDVNRKEKWGMIWAK